jgi:MFS family permease
MSFPYEDEDEHHAEATGERSLSKFGVQPLLSRYDDYEYNDQETSFRSSVSERAVSEARAASIVVFGGIMAYSFVVCLENVIVFPSLWPNLLQYCGEEYDEATLQSYLGWTMGAFSLGRGVSALIINGRAPTRRNMRVAATICFLLSGSGCAMYLLAWSPPMLILSRTLSGLGAGALTLMITALSSLSSPETRTSAISQFFIAAALGEIAGPIISYATVSVDFDMTLFGHVITVNKYNCVGLWTLCLFMLSFIFVCRSIDASAQPDEYILERISLKLFKPRLIMIFTLALFVNMGVSSWETVVTPLAQQHFRWGVESNSLIFILSGAILFFSNIVLVRIATSFKVSDECGTIVSVIVATAGATLLFTLGIFCPLTFVTSMYTKNIVARPSLFIGAFRASSAGIRVVGNILAAYSLSFSGHASSGPNVAFCLSNQTNPISVPSSSPSLLSTFLSEHNVDTTGPELLLLCICICAFVVSSAIACTKPKPEVSQST